MDFYKKLLTSLFSEKTSESLFYSTLNILGKKAESGDPIAKQILAYYSSCGVLNFNRMYAFHLLIKSVNRSDQSILPYVDYRLSWLLQLYKPMNQFKDFIAVHFKIPSRARGHELYLSEQSIEGLLKIKGRDSYPLMVQIACDRNLPMSSRATAMRSLSLSSKQNFDRELPSDLTTWKENDLRLKELLQWEKEGYPEGTGYVGSHQSPAFTNPINQLEIICLNLQKIIEEHSFFYDSAYPSNPFSSGDKNEFDDIKKLLKRLLSQKLSYGVYKSISDSIVSKAQAGNPLAKQILANFYCPGLLTFEEPPTYFTTHFFDLLINAVDSSDEALIPYFDYYLSWNLKLYQPMNQFSDFVTIQYKMPSISKEGKPEGDYWSDTSIQGILNIKGRDAYPQLVQIACDVHLPLPFRATAIKSLSLHSKNKFYSKLPTGSERWEESDFSLKELLQWEKEGYPQGKEFVAPQQSPALSNPITPLEIACSNLQKILDKQRFSYDPANPTNLLIMGDKNEIETIKKKWKLPSTYLDFLERFAPLKVHVYSSKFVNPLTLYGPSDLLEDYSHYGPIPAEYLIIADHSLHDYFVMDLSKSDGEDAPILAYYERRDTFVKYASTFIEFLKKITKK